MAISHLPQIAASVLMLLASLSSNTHAGDLQAQTDLSISIEVQPEQEFYPPGSLLQIEYTVTNDGPDSSPGAYVGAGTFAFSGPNSQVVISPQEMTAPCTFSALDLEPSPGFHGYWITSLLFPELEAGESLTCTLGLEVLDTARGTFPLASIVIPSPYTAEPTVDPNSVNDQVELLLALSPPGEPLPETDLAVSLLLEPSQSVYPPGSNMRLYVTARNDGPDASGGSVFRLEDSLINGPNAPVSVLPWFLDQGGSAPCLTNVLQSAAPPGFVTTKVTFPGIPAGQSRTCSLRLEVLEGAAGTFMLSGTMTPEPDFGDPTNDPNPTNDLAQIDIEITPAGPAPVASPVIVPASGPRALVALFALLCLSAAWRNRL